MGTLGMAIFGLSDSNLAPNQLHILFSPIMTAYGLAFVSILWARIELPAGGALMRYGHFAIVILISAGPLILNIPRETLNALATKDSSKTVWPPYWPPVFSKTLHNATDDNDVIFSDQPWAVAWYADRISIWLPRKVEEFNELEELAEDNELSVAGIVMTPMSFKENVLFSPVPFGYNEDFAPLMLDGPTRGALSRSKDNPRSGMVSPGILAKQSQKLRPIMNNYPEVSDLFSNRIYFYSKQRLYRR